MNIFAAVSNKGILDPLLRILDKKSVNFLGTEGTVKYLKQKGFKAKSVVSGFDFDGRLKSIDKKVFARILADKSSKKHMSELKKLARNTPGVGSGSSPENTPGVVAWEPFDIVIVDLYKPEEKNFPESMDIGGQALIRAAIKNYKNVAVAFDKSSVQELAKELKTGSTSLAFRKKQVKKATKFIAERGKLEAGLF